MVCLATDRMTERNDLMPTQCGAFKVRLTRQWPLTDLTPLCPVDGPLRMRFGQDTDGDNVVDVQTTAALGFEDANGNGQLDRDEDNAVIRVEKVEAMPGARLKYDERDHVAAASRVVEMLGGTPGAVVNEL